MWLLAAGGPLLLYPETCNFRIVQCPGTAHRVESSAWGGTTVGHAWTMHLHQGEVVGDGYGRLPTTMMEIHICLPNLLSREIYSFLGALTRDGMKEIAEACPALRLFSCAAHPCRHQWNFQGRSWEQQEPLLNCKAQEHLSSSGDTSILSMKRWNCRQNNIAILPVFRVITCKYTGIGT